MRLLVVFTIITAVIAIPVDLGSDGSNQQPTNPNPPAKDWSGVTWDTMPIPDIHPSWRPVTEADSIGELPGDYDPNERYTSGADGHDGRWSTFQDIDAAQLVGDALNGAADGVGAFGRFTGLDKLGAGAAAVVGALGLSGFNPLPATSPAGGNGNL